MSGFIKKMIKTRQKLIKLKLKQNIDTSDQNIQSEKLLCQKEK